MEEKMAEKCYLLMEGIGRASCEELGAHILRCPDCQKFFDSAYDYYIERCSGQWENSFAHGHFDEVVPDELVAGLDKEDFLSSWGTAVAWKTEQLELQYAKLYKELEKGPLALQACFTRLLQSQHILIALLASGASKSDTTRYMERLRMSYKELRRCLSANEFTLVTRLKSEDHLEQIIRAWEAVVKDCPIAVNPLLGSTFIVGG